MAAILAGEPDQHSARAVTQIVRAVINGESDVSSSLSETYRDYLNLIPDEVELSHIHKEQPLGQSSVAPLDPFLNLASRLKLPVAVHTHYIEVPLKVLAQHLDSPNSSLRNTLQKSILKLHFAGYALKNHPGLTHKEARELGDDNSR
jgi:hypothetical protein